MEERLKVGLIVKPQGIKGELKVQPLTDDISRFKKLKQVIIDDKNYKVTSATIGGGVVFLSLFGVNDRDLAETLRGKFLFVERKDAVPLEEGRYFIADLIGCEVVIEDGEKIGVIKDIFSSRTDVITVACDNGKIMRFPFLKDLVVSVDVYQKKFIVKRQRLSEVSCYED